MNIEIKKSVKPVNYFNAVREMEERLERILDKKDKELIWTLEHEEIYTAGTNYNENEIIDKSIEIIKTKRGGKLTCHGPGQLIFYFVIDLRKRQDIRKFVNIIEDTIVDTLEIFKVKTFADRKNIGIWYKDRNDIKKIAAIGIRVKKWIAYHGFSININNNLNQYKKIIPCGISDREVTNLKKIINQDYSKLQSKLIDNFITNLKI